MSYNSANKQITMDTYRSTNTGVYNVTVTVTDNAGTTNTTWFTITADYIPYYP